MKRIGIYPSGNQLLLLKAIVFPKAEALVFWRQWTATVSPTLSTAEFLLDSIDENTRRLLSLVYANLHTSGDPWIELLKGYARHVWVRQQRLQQEADILLEAFALNGLNPIVLKGLAMSRSSHSIMTFRVMNDLDIYVAKPFRQKAFELLNQLGFTIIPKDEMYLPIIHAAQFQNRQHIEVDLHWHLFQEHLDGKMDALLVAERLESSGKYSGYRILNPTAQFFHSLYQCSHWDALPNIRWVADCAMIGRSESLDWNAIIKWTEQLQFQSFVPDALAFLQDEMQVEIPDFVFEKLEKIAENSDPAHYFLWTCKPKSLSRFWVGPIRSWYHWKAFTKGTTADLFELFWFKAKSAFIHRASKFGLG